MRAISVLLVAILAALPGACRSAKPDPGDGPGDAFRRAVEAGHQAFAAGDLQTADAEYRAAVHLRPEAAEVWNALALVAFEQRRVAACLGLLDRAIYHRPDYREAWLNRGLAKFSVRNREGALEDFEIVLSFPVEPGLIVGYSAARREYGKLVAGGLTSLTFEEAIRSGLLPVDREAMYARWYAGVTRALLAGPGLEETFVFRTPAYRVVTDVSEDLARRVAGSYGDALGAFREHFPPPPDRLAPEFFQVTVFARRGTYVEFVSRLLGDRATASLASGSYHPLLKELYIVNGESLTDTLLILRHEAFHQYLDTFMAPPPDWFGEGLADYFASAGGVHRKRTADLAAALDSGAPLRLRELMLADHPWFLAASVPRVERRKSVLARNYALSWALAHFLMESDSGSRRALLARYFELLVEGASAERAFVEAFGDVDFAELEADLARYARERLVGARGKNRTSGPE